MKMPGFTADASLYTTGGLYRMVKTTGQFEKGMHLDPALRATGYFSCWRSCMRNCCRYGCSKGAWWWCAAECALACPEWCDQVPPELCEPPIVA